MKEEMSFRDSVKEAIAIALIQLMKERSISHITVKDIVKRAGVGSSSFYRNFDSKEDILYCTNNRLSMRSKILKLFICIGILTRPYFFQCRSWRYNPVD